MGCWWRSLPVNRCRLRRQQLQGDLAESPMSRDAAGLHHRRAADGDDRDRRAGATRVLKYIDLRHRAARAGPPRTCRPCASRHTAPGTRPELAGDVGPGRGARRAWCRTCPRISASNRPEYTLDWENFVPPGGGPSRPDAARRRRSPRATRDSRPPSVQTLGNKVPFVSVGGDPHLRHRGARRAGADLSQAPA